MDQIDWLVLMNMMMLCLACQYGYDPNGLAVKGFNFPELGSEVDENQASIDPWIESTKHACMAWLLARSPGWHGE